MSQEYKLSDKGFCLHCFKEVDYTIKSFPENYVEPLYGISVPYIEVRAYCKECGQEIYVETIAEKSVQNYSDAFYEILKEKGLGPYDAKGED